MSSKRLNESVREEAPIPDELTDALASLAALDPAEAAEQAEELAAELAQRLDPPESD